MNESCKIISNAKFQNLDVDGFRCFLANFSLILTKIQFGYISVAFLVIIILLSVFGGIKEHYRWFILNQTFWDLSLSYQYICNNWAAYFFYGQTDLTCFYNKFGNDNVKAFFEYSISTNSYSALLLFSSIRFAAIYFPMAYQRFTKTKKQVFVIIFLYNFIMILTSTHTSFAQLYKERKSYLNNECLNQNISKVICNISSNNDALVVIYQILFNIFSCFTFLKPLISLLLSFISAFLILLHLWKQSKNKQNNLSSSFRIFLVILLQTLTNFMVFIIEIFKNLPLLLENTFNFKTLTSRATPAYIAYCKDCINLIFPLWLDGQFGLSHHPAIQSIIQIRIVCEVLIILFIMTGYRESFMYFFKLLIPKFFHKYVFFFQKTTTTNITVIPSYNS